MLIAMYGAGIINNIRKNGYGFRTVIKSYYSSIIYFDGIIIGYNEMLSYLDKQLFDTFIIPVDIGHSIK